MNMIDWDRPRQTCPQCEAKGKTLGVGVDPRDGRLKAHCFRIACNYIATFDWDGRETKRSPVVVQRVAESADADRRRKQRTAVELIAQSLPIEIETPAGQYLYGTRRCMRLPADSDLRWVRDLHLFGLSGPALVGAESLATDYRQITGAHITFLQRRGDGWTRGERRYLGPKAGSVIRLWADECVSTGLGIAEGIETAMSLGMAPAWAAMDAGNLAAFPVLSGIECLTIAADNDPAGRVAAIACRKRWVDAGKRVRVLMPVREGADLNDLEMEAA